VSGENTNARHWATLCGFKPFLKEFMQKYIFIFFIFCSLPLLAQKPAPPLPIPPQTDPAQVQKDIIQVDKSNYLEYISTNGVITQKLVGDVWLHQDSVFMYCDSALIENRTKVRAYGHVVIQQGTQVSCFSDSLIYDGVSKIADLYSKDDVILKNGNQTLYAWKTLNYNMNTKVGTYRRGGKLLSDKTQVFSREGEYYVDTHEAFFRKKVFVSDKDFSLKTDTLQYNTQDKTALFLAPTLITQEKAKIYCERGYYDFEKKSAEFLQNPQYQKDKSKATADTIRYDGNLKEVKMIGHASFIDSVKVATANEIRYNESEDVSYLIGDAKYNDGKQNIVGEEITYNNGSSSFSSKGRSVIADSTQILAADNVSFDKEKGVGIAKGNVVWQDTVNHLTIKCTQMDYDKKRDFIKTRGGRPLLITKIDKDSLYLSADTLISYKDTTNLKKPRVLRAYHDVRIFKKDLQAVCDSLIYSDLDSTFHLLQHPLMWSDSSQFLADTMRILLVKNKIDRLLLFNKSFIISEIESDYFNQIKGKYITAFFEEGKIRRMKVFGNAESVYFATNEKEEYIGVNKVASSEMMVFWGGENNKVQNIKFFSQPAGNMSPMKGIGSGGIRLDGFDWQPLLQPKSIEDLLKPKPKVDFLPKPIKKEEEQKGRRNRG
jgi:lipopolysaccharide export system protein LptA